MLSVNMLMSEIDPEIVLQLFDLTEWELSACCSCPAAAGYFLMVAVSVVSVVAHIF